MKRLTFSLFILIITANLFSQQIYPVRTITTVSPPYPTSLEQYANIDGGQISLTLIPNDAALQNYPIKLRLVIDGGYYKIYTNPSFIHKNITLNNGENLTFTGPELAEWFNPDNLIFEGYTKNQYQKTGRLPEGMYQIWFEAYDFYRNINISGPLKEIKATVWTFENDPPYLNFPLHEKELLPTDPQNIVFNWTQRQSPFSAAGAANQYKFELWEITPDDMNVDEAVQTTRPLFSGDVQTTTFNYTADQPILFTGKKYAWRVQVYDPAGKNRYKNNGYSEVRWFRFGKDCTAPAPTLDKAYFTAVGLKWDNDIRFNKYEIRYKNKDIANSNWYTKDATGQAATIDKLEQNTSYYVQMRGFCGAQEGEFSPSITVHTKQDVSFACGGAPGAIDSANNIPLAALKKGEVFHAWDFDVEVFSTTGSNGNFSGKGFALVPLLNSIKFQVEFNGITINDKRRMTQGEVKFVYDAKNGLVVNVNQLIDAITGNGPHSETDPYQNIANENIQVNSPVTDIEVNASGDVTVSTEDGNKQVVRASAATGDMVYVGDSDEGAEQAVVDTKGKTVYTGAPEKTASGAIVQPASKNEPLKYAVNFVPHVLTTWGGMDMPGSNSPAGNYNTVTIGGTQTLIPWKSVETNSIERLVAVVDGAADSIHFITKSDNMVMSALGDKSNVSAKSSDVQMLKDAGILEHLNTGTFKQLLVTGVTDNDELKAWYPEYSKKDKDTVATQDRVLAGQVNVVAYDKINLDVCIVEVNGAAVPDALPIEEELNKIYASALVQWKVTQIKDFKATVTHLVNGKFDSDHPGSMKYNDCENEVIDAFKNRDDYNSHTLYLFFIGGQTTNTGTKGYMQFDRNFGFIFRDNQDINELIRTMAHELGHGAFRLKHTFSDECPYPQTQGNTYNLMDYVGKDKATTAIQFYKYQWDQVRKWSLGVNWFESGDEAASKGDDLNRLLQILKYSGTNSFAFGIKCQGLTKESDGIIFKIKGESYHVFFMKYSYVGRELKISSFDFDKNSIPTDLNVEGVPIPLALDKFILLNQTNTENKVASHLCTDLKEDYSKICETGSLQSVPDLYLKLGNDIIHCFDALQLIAGGLTLEGITSILQNLKYQARDNQQFEFTQNGQVYKLNAQNEAEVVENPESDVDINAGNWSDGNIDMKMRVGYNADGILQFAAMGIRKDLPLAAGKTASLSEISQNMLLKSNALLKQYQVNSVDLTPAIAGGTLDSDEFPDGKKVNIDENASFFKILCEAGGISISFLKTAEVEQPVYLSNSSSTIQAPPVATGTLESVGMVVTDITSAVSTVYDIVTDAQARKQAIDGFVAVKNQIKDDPSKLFPILGEVVLQEFTGSTSEQYGEMADANTNQGRKEHLVTKTGVRTATSIFASGKFLAKLPDMAEEVAVKMANAKSMLKFRKVGEDLGDAFKDLVKNFEKKLKELPDGGKKFLDDFKDAADDDIRKFLENPDLVDSWEKLDELHVDDALRRNTGALEALSKPKGSRPDPSTYLSKDYIDNHLKEFEGGVTKITSYSPSGTVGPPGGTFVLPKSQADALIRQADGDVHKLEDLLGLNRGDLGNNPFRSDVPKPSGLRMPSGNELGANEKWIPGGKTSGGTLEATVDSFQPGTYTSIPILK